MTPHFRFLPLSGFIIGAALLVGCDDHSGQAQQPPSPQVVVHVVKSAPSGEWHRPEAQLYRG